MGYRVGQWLSDFTFTFHFHALKKEMETHSSVLAWRIPGTGEPGGLPSMGLHRIGHNWSHLAAEAEILRIFIYLCIYLWMFEFVYLFFQQIFIRFIQCAWDYTEINTRVTGIAVKIIDTNLRHYKVYNHSKRDSIKYTEYEILISTVVKDRWTARNSICDSFVN